MSDADLTILGRLKRRCMQEPWVPIGGIATVGALFAATLQMRRGNLVSANHLLRLRVATQGLTVTAMLLGSYLALDKKRKESLQEAAQEDASQRQEPVESTEPAEKPEWEKRLEKKLARAERERQRREAASTNSS